MWQSRLRATSDFPEVLELGWMPFLSGSKATDLPTRASCLLIDTASPRDGSDGKKQSLMGVAFVTTRICEGHRQRMGEPPPCHCHTVCEDCAFLSWSRGRKEGYTHQAETTREDGALSWGWSLHTHLSSSPTCEGLPSEAGRS